MPTITDWLMVAITVVYVVATIFICCANIESAKVAKEQTNESKRQFYAVNRPIVSVEICYEKRSFWILRFINHGAQTAYNTKITLNEEFIESVEEKIKPILRENNGKVRTIGVNQVYDLYFGTNEFKAIKDKPNIKGKIEYSGSNSSIYVEDFEIEVNNYATFFTTTSDMEKLERKIDEQNRELKRINNTLEYIGKNLESKKEEK